MGHTNQHSLNDQLIAWTFVGVQAALLVAIVVLPRNADWAPSDAIRVAGGVLMLAGVVLGAWAFIYLGRGLTPSPLPNRSGRLVVRGPYEFARHPIYSGVMLLASGIAMRSGNYLVIASTLGLVVLFSVKARWEEKHLGATFPGYSSYMVTTGRFVPLVGRVQEPLTKSQQPLRSDDV